MLSAILDGRPSVRTKKSQSRLAIDCAQKETFNMPSVCKRDVIILFLVVYLTHYYFFFCGLMAAHSLRL